MNFDLANHHARVDCFLADLPPDQRDMGVELFAQIENAYIAEHWLRRIWYRAYNQARDSVISLVELARRESAPPRPRPLAELVGELVREQRRVG